MTQTVLDRAAPPAGDRMWYGDGPSRFAEMRLPEGDGPHPCVIAIHGGFWRNAYGLDHLGHLCGALTDQGLATWNVEYRRMGDPGGGWPGTFRDVSAASAYLFDNATTLGIDPGRIFVLGHSAGGQLASWLANKENVPPDSSIRTAPLHLRGAIPMAGVLDLREGWTRNLGNGAVREFLGGTPDDVPDRYDASSPVALAPSPVPHLLVHGSDDDTVPIEMSEMFRSSATLAGQRASLRVFPGAGHLEIIDPESRFWPGVAAAILAFVDEEGRKTSPPSAVRRK